jgi:hypothetical protein
VHKSPSFQGFAPNDIIDMAKSAQHTRYFAGLSLLSPALVCPEFDLQASHAAGFSRKFFFYKKDKKLHKKYTRSAKVILHVRRRTGHFGVSKIPKMSTGKNLGFKQA